MYELQYKLYGAHKLKTWYRTDTYNESKPSLTHASESKPSLASSLDSRYPVTSLLLNTLMIIIDFLRVSARTNVLRSELLVEAPGDRIDKVLSRQSTRGHVGISADPWIQAQPIRTAPNWPHQPQEMMWHQHIIMRRQPITGSGDPLYNPV
jgi:hypothetical protein